MKDEEMAEQFADDINGLELTCSLLSAKDKSHSYRLGRYDGFLAGLKAGRPQWHKVKDELPTNTGLYLIFYYNSFFNDKVRCIARYSPDRKEFLNLNLEDGDEVIAWQELPAPPKESE